MPESTPQVKFRKDYTVPAFLIDTVELDFDLREELTTVRARLALRRNPAAPDAGAPLRLHGEELELVQAQIDGRALAVGELEVDEEGLEIAGVPNAFTLETEVRIRPAKNTALEGLYKAGPHYCTQCEAEGFRKITFFLDRPDVMARYTVRIEADRERYPVLLSNGNLVGAGEGGAGERSSGGSGAGRHWVRYEDPFPKPSYLFALVAGDLASTRDRYTTGSGREVELEIFVEKENLDKTEHAMRSLKKSMAWDEEVFGLECDLDQYKIVAVNDFNMGAMENKGLNVFNSKFVLAKPETATDDDYEGIEGVIAHEYFHNWTGNRVTCRDWFQLSLKEGLTVFRDQQFSGDMTSHPVKRIAEVRILRTHQFAEDSGPMAHPVRPESYIEMNNFYTVTVYNKGAEVVRMYHTLLGAEGFRKGMDLYFERHDGQAVTCDDFRAAMADANGVDLGQFERWYSQAGTPVIDAVGEYDPAARTYTLALEQSAPPTPEQETKQPFHVPFAVGLLGRGGEELVLRLSGEGPGTGAKTRVLELREERQRFTFVDVPERPIPSLLRGFSAPVKLRCDRPRDELAFLMAHDADPFNRWDAGQEYALELLLELAEAHRAGRELALDERFVVALRETLHDGRLDESLRSLALTLPAESWVAEQMEVADPDAIHAARTFARREIARALRAELLAAYSDRQQGAPYSIDQASIGRRRLKNVCLGYLMALAEPEVVALCTRHLDQADNMTDASAALVALSHHDLPERERALADFYARWEDEPLVVDKWFAIQATADLPDVVERVRALMRHPAFSLKNPNRARSLVGAFAVGNFAHFHEASGAGYAFLAERVIELNEINRQVASRMVDALLRWRRYDAARQEKMRGELERILATPQLSKNVYEKVSKSLEPAPVA